MQKPVHEPSKLDRAMLRQRVHERGPENPEFRDEEVFCEEIRDRFSVEKLLRGERELHEIDAVAPSEAEALRSHCVAAAVEDSQAIVVTIPLVELQDLLRYRQTRIGGGGNERK